MIPFYIYIVIFLVIVFSIYGLYKFNTNQTTQTKIVNEPQYTIETLVGKSGKVIRKYEENKFLGTLDDGFSTPIVVKISDTNKECINKQFIIEKLDGCDIVAKLV